MRYPLFLLLLGLSAGAVGAPVDVLGMRAWEAPDHLRLVFDLSGQLEHKVFSLRGPDRLVIDLDDARAGALLGPKGPPTNSYYSTLRTGTRNGGRDLRVVLDLKKTVRPKTFLLKPNQQYGYRLVVDLLDSGQRPRPALRADRVSPGDAPRDVIVAIDAGHGGEDPGALGRRKTREKDVVLAVARKLERQLDAEPGMRGVLVRNGDYYIGLRQRMQKAREQRADLFVSIHADAFRDHRARGSSVFVISERGASSEAARWLAESENASDLVGGVSLDDKDDDVVKVLLDLSQSATAEHSYKAASAVLKEMGGINRLHKRRVERAGFMVLKSPDIPSLLVETAFISNPEEERKLRDPKHQEALAGAIAQGIKRYFQHDPPPGTLLAQIQRQTHVIARGETLSEIAAQYRVSVDSLRRRNGLTTDTIRIGQVLQIPVGDT